MATLKRVARLHPVETRGLWLRARCARRRRAERHAIGAGALEHGLRHAQATALLHPEVDRAEVIEARGRVAIEYQEVGLVSVGETTELAVRKDVLGGVARDHVQ